MAQYDNLIMPDKAKKAARILKQYCNQTGCMYCRFALETDIEGQKTRFCGLATAPRNYGPEVVT